MADEGRLTAGSRRTGSPPANGDSAHPGRDRATLRSNGDKIDPSAGPASRPPWSPAGIRSSPRMRT